LFHVFEISRCVYGSRCPRGRGCEIPTSTVSCLVGFVFNAIFEYPLSLIIANLAVFQGFLVFTRGNAYWASISSSWGYTVGPWMMIASFLILFFAYLTKMRFWMGSWMWVRYRVDEIELREEEAPGDAPIRGEKTLWRKALYLFLNHL
jgi:hypothetical protein